MSYFSPLINPATRNQPSGVAGLYACKTILNEHRPVCTKEYSLTGKYLDGVDNPDVWFPIAGAGGGAVTYLSRFLTIASGTGAISGSRCVIDQAKFKHNANFIEVTAMIGASAIGAGGSARNISFGFQSGFSGFAAAGSTRAIFWRNSTGNWYIATKTTSNAVSLLPLGRNIAGGDILTVRLDRVEGQADINIVRFYVNGQKQFETTDVPTEDVYAGIGAYCDASCTTATSIEIQYFGCKYVP